MNHQPSTAAVPSRCDPSAAGLLACLRMLVAEAFSLDLPHTAQVLAVAIDTCVSEHADVRSCPQPARH